MKIALYKVILSESCSYESIYDEMHAKFAINGATRISEWIDVEFPPRKPEEFIPEQIAVLDKAEQELRAKFQQKLMEIAEQRGKLLALTYQPAKADHEEQCACGRFYEPVDENGEEDRCPVCRENAAEAAYERAQEEPTFRGNEYAAHLAAEQDEARRLK